MPDLNLNGVWLNDRGERVEITQQGSSLRSRFLTAAACPHGGTRSFCISGSLTGDQVTGEYMACTAVRQLVTDCNLEPVYTVNFRGTATRRLITGEYKPDYVNYEEKEGRFTNCRVRPGGGDTATFTLTRVGCDPDELAKAKELLDSYEKTLKAYQAARRNLKQGKTFEDVQDAVEAELAAKTGKHVTTSGSTGDGIQYKGERFDDVDTSSVREPLPGKPDPRRSWEVDIPVHKSSPSSYPIVDQVTDEHEQGHADAIRRKFGEFKDGKIEWKTWEQYRRFEGGKKEIQGYIDEEIARYAQGIRTLRDFIKDCVGTPVDFSNFPSV